MLLEIRKRIFREAKSHRRRNWRRSLQTIGERRRAGRFEYASVGIEVVFVRRRDHLRTRPLGVDGRSGGVVGRGASWREHCDSGENRRRSATGGAAIGKQQRQGDCSDKAEGDYYVFSLVYFLLSYLFSSLASILFSRIYTLLSHLFSSLLFILFSPIYSLLSYFILFSPM
jgi:hypothetical protein